MLLFAMCALVWLVPVTTAHGGGMENDLDGVLRSAEGFFQTLKAADYRQAWSLLSLGSREVITDDIYKGSVSPGSAYTKEQITSDLQAGGMIATSFWKGVLQYFDPNKVLEESKWETGFIRPDRAELLITHRRSTNPAHLKLFKESGSWKVGMVESFWTRKK